MKEYRIAEISVKKRNNEELEKELEKQAEDEALKDELLDDKKTNEEQPKEEKSQNEPSAEDELLEDDLSDKETTNKDNLSEQGESKEKVLYGMPIIFDTPTKITSPHGSDYTEIIKRGALDNADMSDVRLFYNHDINKVPLGRTPKTLQLNLTSVGLEMNCKIPDTEEARSVYTAVERGDITGMSFGFKVVDNGDTYDRETNTRTIHKIERLYEISVVNYPAYPQTSVEARSNLNNMQSEKRTHLALELNKLLYDLKTNK